MAAVNHITFKHSSRDTFSVGSGLAATTNKIRGNSPFTTRSKLLDTTGGRSPVLNFFCVSSGASAVVAATHTCNNTRNHGRNKGQMLDIKARCRFSLLYLNVYYKSSSSRMNGKSNTTTPNIHAAKSDTSSPGPSYARGSASGTLTKSSRTGNKIRGECSPKSAR